MILVPYPLNIGAYLLFGGFFGGSIGVLQPVTWSNYFGPRSFASIQGAIRPFIAIPQLTVPLFIAFLYDRTDTFDIGFLILGGVTMFGAVTAMFARPPVRGPAPTVTATA